MALTLDEGRSSAAVRLWQDLGLLAVVLPEVVAAERLAPTLAALERLDDMLAHLEAWFPASAGAVAERLAQPVDGALRRPVALRLAGLMHRLPPQDAVAAGRRLKLSVADDLAPGDGVRLLRSREVQLPERFGRRPCPIARRCCSCGTRPRGSPK